MVKSAAERQREFRAKSKDKFKRLDTLLPVEVFNLLHGNATRQGLTKAAYISELLHGNNAMTEKPSSYDAQFTANKELSRLQGAVDELESELAAVKKQLKAGSDDHEARQALQKERDALLAQVKELERIEALDAAILDDLRAERDKLLHANTDLSPHGYGTNIVISNWIEKITGQSGGNLKTKLTADAMAALELKGKARYLPDANKARLLDWIKENTDY